MSKIIYSLTKAWCQKNVLCIMNWHALKFKCKKMTEFVYK